MPVVRGNMAAQDAIASAVKALTAKLDSFASKEPEEEVEAEPDRQLVFSVSRDKDDRIASVDCLYHGESEPAYTITIDRSENGQASVLNVTRRAQQKKAKAK